MGGAGRLPPHLLFSDRDFDENDYEALLALDEGVESRKGAFLFDVVTVMLVLTLQSHCVCVACC